MPVLQLHLFRHLTNSETAWLTNADPRRADRNLSDAQAARHANTTRVHRGQINESMAAGSPDRGIALPCRPERLERITVRQSSSTYCTNMMISGLGNRILRTCRPQTLLQHHFFPRPRHTNPLPQSITSPHGPLRLMSRRPESFQRGTTEPKHFTGRQSRAADQHLLANMLAICLPCACIITLKFGTVRVRQTVPFPRFVDRCSSHTHTRPHATH